MILTYAVTIGLFPTVVSMISTSTANPHWGQLLTPTLFVIFNLGDDIRWPAGPSACPRACSPACLLAALSHRPPLRLPHQLAATKATTTSTTPQPHPRLRPKAARSRKLVNCSVALAGDVVGRNTPAKFALANPKLGIYITLVRHVHAAWVWLGVGGAGGGRRHWPR